MKKIYALLSLSFFVTVLFAQPTLPSAFNLTSGNYALTAWDSLAPAGTYPANMVFHYTISTENPAYDHMAESARDFDCPYNLRARNRILGMGAGGFAFLATSSAQYNDCSGAVTTADTNRYVGDVVLALNTAGKTMIGVKWTGTIITIGDGGGDTTLRRQATVRLQYRVGSTGSYTDVLNGMMPVESNSAGRAAGAVVNVTATLPAACENQPLVYLRWVYFAVAVTGSKGTRPEISADDIAVGVGALPVTLLSFGVSNHDGAASLSWKTANEINFSHFEIEKSGQGSAFSSIASVAAQGSSNGNVYSFTDTKAATGNSLYRLKMVNRDGTYSYSGVVAFTVNVSGNLSVAPNPVLNSFTLTHPQASANAMIVIVGLDGKKAASYAIAANTTQTTMNAGNLATGNYLLVYTDGKQKLTVKFAKK